MVRAATESEGTDRMTKMPKLMAAAGAALLALLIAGAALAQSPPNAPHTFWGRTGDVTIDGANAPARTQIVAWAGGEQVGSGNIEANGDWAVDVEGGTTGVTFTVRGIPVPDVTYDAVSGANDRLTLAVVSTPDPHTFSGTATLDGAPASVMEAADPDALEADEPMAMGVTITATADGEETVTATSSTADGSWSLEVTGGTDGWTISTMINGEVVTDAGAPRSAPAGGSTPGIELAMTSPEPAAPFRFYGTVTLDGAPAMMSAMDSDSMMGGDGDSMMGDDGDSMMGEDSDSMMGEDGDSMMGDGDSMMGGDGDSMMGGNGAAMGATITATADGQETVTTTSDPADGSWSLEVPGDTDGWTITATITTADGVTLTDSDSGLTARPAGGSQMIPLALLSPAPVEEPVGTDEEPPTEGDGEGTMMEGDDEDPPTVGDATGLPDTGSGGLADGSRGVSTAVYGGIAGALALIALVGGAAIRRRSQS